MTAKDLCDFPRATLGKRLLTWQLLVLHKVLPSVAGLFIYIVLIVADSALVYQHITDGNPIWATVLIFLAYAPSVVAMIFTLSSPSQWPHTKVEDEDICSEEPWDHRLSMNQIRWCGLQVLNTLIFPISTISRYTHQVFWSVEAVCATWLNDDTRIEESLLRLYEPSPIELYLFLQPFLHSAPNSLLQLHMVLGYGRDHNTHTASIQILSIIMSIFRMAAVATVYQRFERQRVTGRRYPWDPLPEMTSSDDEEAEEEQPKAEIKEVLPPPTKVFKETSFDFVDSDSFDGTESMLEFEEAVNMNTAEAKNRDKSFSIIDRVAKRRSTDSDYLPPRRSVCVDDGEIEEVSEDADVKYRKMVSVEENSGYNITDMSNFTTPPSLSAPRFSTLAMLKNRIASGAEAFADRMPQRRARPASPELPVRVRSAAVRGLERDDFAASLVEFVAWFLFVVSRLLTLCSFTEFYPVLGVWIILAHYSLMTIFLMINSDTAMRRAFYLFLGFVYVFCLIEFKVRFRHVRLWYAGWTVLCAFQTVIMTSAWMLELIADDSTGYSSEWWYLYTVMLIAGSTILSYACALVYVAILKPRDKVVYPEI